MLDNGKEERFAREQDRIRQQFRSIQVSGLRHFEEHHWRDAILYFLFGIWSDHGAVTYRPKIDFLGFGFRLDPAQKYYEISAPITGSRHTVPDIAPSRILDSSASQYEFEGALVRFVKNDQIKMLRVDTIECDVFYLWKAKQRGDLQYARTYP